MSNLSTAPPDPPSTSIFPSASLSLPVSSSLSSVEPPKVSSRSFTLSETLTNQHHQQSASQLTFPPAGDSFMNEFLRTLNHRPPVSSSFTTFPDSTFSSLQPLSTTANPLLVDSSALSSSSLSFLPFQLDSPPLDWSLYRRVRFSSLSPFSWISFSSSLDESGGLKDFLTQQQEANASFYRQFHCASFYCSYPSSSTLLSRSHYGLSLLQDAHTKGEVHRTSSDRLAIAYLAQRWNEWETAFRSIYFKFRNGETQYFYLDCSSFTVLFVQDRASSDSEHFTCYGIISRSSKGFRSLLIERGISFSQPNSRQSANVDHCEEYSLADFQRLEKSKPGSTRHSSVDPEKEEDFSMASLLLLSGRSSVHQLFDFFLNDFSRSADGIRREEVPRILSSTPFLHCAMEKLEVVASGKQLKGPSGVNSIDRANSPLVQYYIDLVGPLLPTSNVRLLKLLKEAQKDEFTCRYWIDENSNNQNKVINGNSNQKVDSLLVKHSSSNFNSLSSVSALHSLWVFPTNAVTPIASVNEIQRIYNGNPYSNKAPLKVAPPVRRVRCQQSFHIQLYGAVSQ
jgi:hypothetical protein